MVVINKFFFVFLIVGGLLCPPNLQAEVQELVIRQDVTVYKKPKANADVLTNLESGDRVPVSTRDYGAWKKIKVEVGGRTQFGWVKESDVKESRVRVVESSNNRSGAYHTKRGVGVFYHFSYVNIGEFDFTSDTTPSLDVNVKDLSGTSSFIGLHYDHPWNDKKMIRFYFSLREHDLEGDATFSGSIANSAEFSQKMLAFGATLRNYDSSKDNFWWGYGLEIAKITDATVTYNATDTEVPDEDLPFYVLPHLAAGYDFMMTQSLYLLLDAKLHLILNADGLSYAVDTGVSITYAF
ncbi:MAG: hypothetical protein KDD37_10905 [Bdellovibrionales bacterium]|nr:hypothetical protein [Bdellovibrionales bacterium]